MNSSQNVMPVGQDDSHRCYSSKDQSAPQMLLVGGEGLIERGGIRVHSRITFGAVGQRRELMFECTHLIGETGTQLL